MKKYFAIAFVLLVILLLVLRKQTEPRAFTSPKASPSETAKVSETAKAKTTTTTPTTMAAIPQQAGQETATPSVNRPTVNSPQDVEELRSKLKSAAAGGYTAQRAFQAEWNRFTSDLVFMGWEPTMPELNYKMGFLGALVADAVDEKEKPQRYSTDAFINEETDQSSEKIRYTRAAEKINLSDYARYCQQGCVATKDSFELLLVLPLDEQGHVDVWTINDKKEMKQVVDGTAAH
jgi:Na+-transporting methylmalonyl-CoA/oxaloacetate decarboxylase gamma subunit